MVGLSRQVGAAAPEIWKGFGSSRLPWSREHPSAGTPCWDEAVPTCITCRGSNQPGAVNYEMLWVPAYTLVYFQSIALLFVPV